MINKLKSLIKLIVLVLIIVLIFDFFGGKGLIGFIIIMLLFALYRLWVFRDNFMMVQRSVESTIYGKPLDKEYWDKDELKNLKIKFEWRNNKKDDK